jgi:molecular chaperone GrpE
MTQDDRDQRQPAASDSPAEAPAAPPEAGAGPEAALAAEPGPEAGALPPAEPVDPEAALAVARQEAERLQDRLLRLQAEFENYRKRVARERAEFSRFAVEGLAFDLLPVLDNLERALAAARLAEGTSALIEGVELTLKLFRAALERVGVTPLESLGLPFDPARHEAVAQVDLAEGEDQTVIAEVQRGYLIHGRVLRPAMVQVSRVARPAAPAAGDGGEGPAGPGGEPTA